MIKKLSAMSIAALLIISFNFTVYVSASWDKQDSDGFWIDEFEDDDNIEMKYCNIKEGKINLSKGLSNITYNSDKYPKKVKAWYKEFGITGGLFGNIISKFISPSINPGTAVEDKYISDIGKLDDKRLVTESFGTDIKVLSPIHHFQFKIDQKIDNIDYIYLRWWFGKFVNVDTTNLEELSLWVWMHRDIMGVWKELDTIDYNTGNIKYLDSRPDIDVTMPKEYISDDGFINFIVIGVPENNDKQSYLYTDKVEIEVGSKFGYKNYGEVISDPIDPDDSITWERVFWNSTKATTKSNITIKVLNEDEEEITGYESVTSPLDISGISNKVIRLKAEFNSNSPDSTPYLYSWGVTYQKGEGFADSFKSNYRIESLNGVKLHKDSVIVDSYYGDWPFFGKYSDNSRAYDDTGIKDKPNKIYWYTAETNCGGGYRTPVIDDEKVYVATTDDRIVVFNKSFESQTKIQKPIRSTEKIYTVEECIAVTEKNLIIGENEANSENKIYALNIDNFSEVNWDYPKNNQKICFSSPPIIDNGRIFISSWSGSPFETPFLSFLNKFNPKNNKLIALDLSNGETIWEDSVVLPAGSFSSPAIGEDAVFVGCQNMWGGSLFAFDIESGEELWNASAGIIEKSSPVYGDGKVFVSSNVQQNLTSSSVNQIIAYDAEDGKELWNITIGESRKASIINRPFLGGSFYEMIDRVAPISTPAYSDGMLFVLTPAGNILALNADSGKENWSYTISDGSVAPYFVTSPIVVGDYVYIVTGKGVLYKLNKENDKDKVKEIWQYKIERPNWWPSTIDVIASPSFSDGVIFVSSTNIERGNGVQGKLYAVGNISKNAEGSIVSKTISVGRGHWWNKLNVSRVPENNTGQNNTILIDVLNEDNEVILSSLNGINNDLSDLSTNKIKLRARLKITNSNDTEPSLDSWSISWDEEKEGPVFDNDSFKPGEENWINNLTPIFSIDVEDKADEDILSGLDLDSAKFRIIYNNSKKYITTDWHKATSDDSSGVKKTTIYANVGDLGIKDIVELKDIRFFIKDLAGNSESFNKSNFKFDSSKPTSEITGEYEAIYSEGFTISAEADDTGSGISKVSLKQRYKKFEDGNWSEWEVYDDTSSEPYEWDFETDNSGFYQVMSIATDKASNEEDVDESEIIYFFIDMVAPELDSADVISTSSILPRIKLEISDDYLLDSIYYSFNTTNWEGPIAEEINKDTYSKTWQLPDEIWENMVYGDSKPVYFRIIDANGNEYITTPDESPIIEKDINASKYYIDTSDFSEWHWDNKFTIYANIPAGVEVENVSLFFKYSKNGEDWPENFTIYDEKIKAPFKWTMEPPEGSGYYKFKTVITDVEGEIYESSSTVNVTMFPTTLFLLLIILTIMLVIVIIVIRSRMKRKL
jgi:outer membrane protein assembly factor BamB